MPAFAKHLGLVFIGVILSGLFLWLALRQVDGDDLRSAFSSIRYDALLIFAAFQAASVSLRSVRWRMIAGQPVAAQHHFFRATALGVFSNLIFPLRVGELVRVITLAKLTGDPLPGPIASAVIDRVIDLLVLLLSAVVVYWFSPTKQLLGGWLISMGIATGILIVLIGIYAKSTGVVETIVFRVINRWFQRWPVRPKLLLAELRSELRHLIQGWFSVKLLVLVMLILLLDYAAIGQLLRTFRLELSPEAPLVLWVFLAAGSVLPSTPGYVGVYQAAAVWVLSFYSVSASASVAIATMLQVTVLAVAILMAGPGAWSMCRRVLNASR